MRGGRWWFTAGYLGITGFFVLEATTRSGGAAASLEASGDDQDTTRAIVAAYALSAALAPLVRRIPGPALPRLAAPAGLLLQASGLGLRSWSMRALGRSYSRTLRTDEAQPLVESGPYAVVRHPGYAGSLMTWLGFALTSGSLAVVVLVSGLVGRAYQRRIAAEEALLLRDLPLYASYRQRTSKLLPCVW